MKSLNKYVFTILAGLFLATVPFAHGMKRQRPVENTEEPEAKRLCVDQEAKSLADSVSALPVDLLLLIGGFIADPAKPVACWTYNQDGRLKKDVENKPVIVCNDVDTSLGLSCSNDLDVKKQVYKFLFVAVSDEQKREVLLNKFGYWLDSASLLKDAIEKNNLNDLRSLVQDLEPDFCGQVLILDTAIINKNDEILRFLIDGCQILTKELCTSYELYSTLTLFSMPLQGADQAGLFGILLQGLNRAGLLSNVLDILSMKARQNDDDQLLLDTVNDALAKK